VELVRLKETNSNVNVPTDLQENTARKTRLNARKLRRKSASTVDGEE
jgi:hypothetical protein